MLEIHVHYLWFLRLNSNGNIIHIFMPVQKFWLLGCWYYWNLQSSFESGILLINSNSSLTICWLIIFLIWKQTNDELWSTLDYDNCESIVFHTDDPCYNINCGVGTCSGGTCNCPGGYSGSICQTCKFYRKCSIMKKKCFPIHQYKCKVLWIWDQTNTLLENTLKNTTPPKYFPRFQPIA